MNYAIKYWKEKETNPIEFLNHFRCTTEPIGGGTEHDDDGELVNYDAAIEAISIAEKTIIDKACKWLFKNTYKHVDDSRVYMTFTYTVDMIEDFRKALEE